MAIAWGASALARSSSTLAQATGAVTTQASGSAFIVAAQWSRNTATFASIADSKLNTYVLIDTQLDWEGANGAARLYYCENGTGGTLHTATFTTTGTAGPMTVIFGEITGGLTSGILDQHTRREDTASPYTLAAGLTTTQADELLLTFMAGNTGSNPGTHAESGLGSSTIQQQETNGSSFWTAALATAVKSSTGTFNPSWTESGASAAAVFLATFKAAGGGGGSTPTKGRLSLLGVGI